MPSPLKLGSTLSVLSRLRNCIQSGSSALLWDLSCLLHLSSIRLDWFSPNLSPSFYSSLSNSCILPFLNCPSSVEHLDLRVMSWPTPEEFQNIPRTPGLGYLKTLEIKQGLAWCGRRCGFSSVRSKGRKIGLVYEGGYGLSVSANLLNF